MYSFPFNFALVGTFPSQEFGMFHKILYHVAYSYVSIFVFKFFHGGLYQYDYDK